MLTVLHVTATPSLHAPFLFDLLFSRGDDVKVTGAPLNRLGKGGVPGGKETMTILLHSIQPAYITYSILSI